MTNTIERPASYSPDLDGFVVTACDMSPQFDAGDTIIVDPSALVEQEISTFSAGFDLRRWIVRPSWNRLRR